MLIFLRFIDEVEKSPETSEDDSHKPSHYVMSALGILVDAINAAQSQLIIDDVYSASIGMLNLTADVDFVVEKSEHKINVSLEQMETEIQKKIFLLLKSENRLNAINAIREYIKPYQLFLKNLFPLIRKAHGW